MSGAVGVERIFLLTCQLWLKSTKGAVRRARIFYFRELTGKKAKSKTKKIVTILYHKNLNTVGFFV
jgi:large subunit ribosomal protein L19